MFLFLALLQGSSAPAARLDPAFQQSPTLELTRIRHLLRLPSGQILLVDAPGSTIYRLDSLGRGLPPLSREGSGPGESKGVFGLAFTRDTVWVIDGISQRLTYYSPDLRLLGSQRYQDRCGRLPWAIMADGRCLVLIQDPLPPSVPDPDNLMFPLTLVGNGVADTIAQWPVQRIRVRYADAESQLTQPFGDTPLFQWSPNGRFYGWIGRRAISEQGPPRVAVEVYSLGSSRQPVRFEVPFTPQRLREEAIDSFLALQKSPGRQWPGLPDSIRRRLYRPKMLPAVTRALIRDDGSVWLGEPPAQGTTVSVWRIFTPTGVESARFTLPSGFSLMAVSGRRLLGAVNDEDDVPHLVQYLMPAAGR